jgi:hypothetical protein
VNGRSIKPWKGGIYFALSGLIKFVLPFKLNNGDRQFNILRNFSAVLCENLCGPPRLNLFLPQSVILQYLPALNLKLIAPGKFGTLVQNTESS